RLEQHVNQLVTRHAVSLSRIVPRNAVPQCRLRHSLNVRRRSVVAAEENRPGLSRGNQRQNTTRTGAPIDPFVDKIWGLSRSRPRGANESPGIPQNLIADRYTSHQPLQIDNFLTRKHRPNLTDLPRAYPTGDFPLLA